MSGLDELVQIHLMLFQMKKIETMTLLILMCIFPQKLENVCVAVHLGRESSTHPFAFTSLNCALVFVSKICEGSLSKISILGIIIPQISTCCCGLNKAASLGL